MHPIEGSPLYLYLSITNESISLVLIQETDKAERHVHFVSKVFKGAESQYYNIERVSLAVMIIVRKLRPYFQGHRVMVKTNYDIRQVLKNPYLTGRMISWAINYRSMIPCRYP